jgi:hypothetical protein
MKLIGRAGDDVSCIEFKNNADGARVARIRALNTGLELSGLAAGTGNLLISTAGAVSMTNGLAVTGTLSATGSAAVGGASVITTAGLNASPTALTSTVQAGVRAYPVGTSAGTDLLVGFLAAPNTAAAAYTCTEVVGFYASSNTKGAGSTITSHYGLKVENLAQGASNYGVHLALIAGANNWGIYAAGTAKSYFGGTLEVADTTDATSTTAASLKTAGGLAVVKKTYCGDNIVMASGKGIDFSATSDGSGTMTSEVLSDYEEGTWTGTLRGVGAAPTTPVTATGRYTKIGREVTVAITYSSVDLTGASGGIQITGLPFTVGTVAGLGSGYLVGLGTAVATFDAIAGTVYVLAIDAITGSSVNVVAAAGKSLAFTSHYSV